jgi:HD-GYP domain-containing protein (c-di-GMP phosphodiesterase class II)
MTFSHLAFFIILGGWLSFVIYAALVFEAEGNMSPIDFFLSPTQSGIRFRALAFFAPFILTIIGFLVNEREKLFRRMASSAMRLDEVNADLLRYNERLATLHEIEMAITASLDLRAILNILTEKVASQFDVDAAAVLLLKPDKMALECAAATGFQTERIRHVYLRMGESYAGAALRENKKIVIPDVSLSEESYLTDGNYNFMSSELFREEGFQAYFAIPLRVHGKARGVLEIFHRTPRESDKEWIEYLDALAAQAALAIENASLYDRLRKAHDDLSSAYDTTIEGWSRALDMSEKESEGHSRRVRDLTVAVAQAMGVPEEDIVHMRRGALLHDIGLISMPDRILFKDGPLSGEERVMVERHPEIAYSLLAPIAFLAPALDIPRYHHERWDGRGYPAGLVMTQIPLAARIFAAVDVYDSLRIDRPFRAAWPEEKVVEHMREESGRHFDPAVVAALLGVVARAAG